jgi:hypothetical protein
MTMNREVCAAVASHHHYRPRRVTRPPSGFRVCARVTRLCSPYAGEVVMTICREPWINGRRRRPARSCAAGGPTCEKGGVAIPHEQLIGERPPKWPFPHRRDDRDGASLSDIDSRRHAFPDSRRHPGQKSAAQIRVCSGSVVCHLPSHHCVQN